MMINTETIIAICWIGWVLLAAVINSLMLLTHDNWPISKIWAVSLSVATIIISFVVILIVCI